MVIKEFKIIDKVIRVAFWNTKGIAHIAAREKLVHFMIKEHIEILFLSEAHVNTNSTEKHGDYIFFFSTNVTEADRKKAEEAKKKQLEAGKGKGKGKEGGGDSNIEIHNIEAEN